MSNPDASSCPLSPPQISKGEKVNCPDAFRMANHHRQRGQPTIDINEPAIDQIKFYLDKYKIKEALNVFFDDNTLKLLRVEPDFMWDIIPLICRRLRGLCQYRFRVFEGCEKMLHRIATEEHCNPKEVLISLLAELTSESDNVFRALIRPLESTLLRMNYPSPRDENLRWVINILMRHINNIGLPQEFSLDCKNRPKFNEEPTFRRYIEVLPLILGFIDSFSEKSLELDSSSMPILTQSQLDGILNGELVDDDSLIEQSRSREIACHALMNLLHRPLTFIDLTIDCASMKLIANRFLGKLLRLQPNLFSPIYKRLDSSTRLSTTDLTSGNPSTNDSNNIALATCSYIYRCERLATLEIVPYFPQVITYESIFWCHIPYIVALLEKPEVFAHEKGLLLLESLIRNIELDCLDNKFLATIESSSLIKQIFHITVFSPAATNRRKAYEMFTRICDLLTYECKLKLFLSIIEQSDLRPCIRAACIDQYRRYLTNIYRKLLDIGQSPIDTPNEEQSATTMLISQLTARYKLMSGQSLIDFLNSSIKASLPESQHTDIIENYEILLATLTMLRFLKLRKPIIRIECEDAYLSGSKLKKIFFDPLRGAIAIITKDLIETQSVGKPDEAECLSWALCRLDLVESVLVRTCDLYNC